MLLFSNLEAFGVIWVNTLQELAPGEKLGRLASIDNLGLFALLPAGFALAGVATEGWGAALVCVAGSAATVALHLAGLLHPPVRKLD